MNMFKSKAIAATISIINALCLALLFSSINISAYTAKEAADKSKAIINTILTWSGPGKSVFMKESNPVERTQNVFNGDNYILDEQLPWIKDMRTAQTFILKFAKDSDSLKKAWNQIVITNAMIKNILAESNAMKGTSMAEKVARFNAPMTLIQSMRNSLNDELKTVNGVRMWFYDTQASKDIVLAALPVFRTALDRILSDFKMLKEQSSKAPNNAPSAAKPAPAEPAAPQAPQAPQAQKSGDKLIAELKALFANRNSKDRLNVGALKQESPASFKQTKPAVQKEPAPKGLTPNQILENAKKSLTPVAPQKK